MVAARRAALGGIIGPVAFVATWFLAGLAATRYSPVHDPISDLAGVHASTRFAMTAGFLVFGIGMCTYAWALRAALAGPAWGAAAVAGVATLGVAAFPLHHSTFVDTLHGVSAGTGYVALVATAFLAVAPLARRGLQPWARGATVAGVVAATALALTLLGSWQGALQRFGLFAGDCWIVASAVAIRREWWEAPSDRVAGEEPSHER